MNKTGTHQTTRWTMQLDGGPRYLLVEATARILVLEDSSERCNRFLSWMPDCIICRTVAVAIAAFDGGQFDWIFIDRDLGSGGYGEDFAKHVARVGFQGRTIIHSANLVVARYMEQVLRDAKISVEVVPFTVLGVFQERASDACSGPARPGGRWSPSYRVNRTATNS